MQPNPFLPWIQVAQYFGYVCNLQKGSKSKPFTQSAKIRPIWSPWYVRMHAGDESVLFTKSPACEKYRLGAYDMICREDLS
jgi:hypothetical protein